MRRTRNRREKPIAGPLSTTSLAMWRDNADRLAWATTEPRFREAVTVLRNESQNIIHYITFPPGIPLSENRQLGWREGFDAAVNVLSLLAGAPENKQDVSQDDPVKYPAIEQEESVGDF